MARETKQQQYDREALELLAPRLPEGYRVVGPGEIELPVPPGTPLEKRAAMSIRVSKGREEMISPDLQWDSGLGLVNRKGFHICKLWIDMHKTGRTFEKRAVARMEDEVRAGKYSQVILWKWSRWGRNLMWSQVYLHRVESAGGRVHAATEDIDTSTPVGKLTRSQILAIAEFESDTKSLEWKAVHTRRRDAGLTHAGGARFGYVYEKGGYALDPTTAAILRQAFLDYTAGLCDFADLAHRFNALNLRTTMGNAWQAATVHSMMCTGFAAGLLRRRVKGEWVYEEGSHEGLISRQEWDNFNAARRNPNNFTRGPRRAPRPFSGLLWHTECDQRLGFQRPYTTRHGVYNAARFRCVTGGSCPGTSVLEADLEAHFLEWVLESATGGGDIDARMRRLREDQQRQAEAEQTQQLLTEVLATQERIREMRKDGLYTRERANAEMEEQEKEERKLRARLAELRAGDGDWSPTALRTFAEAWPLLDDEGKRAAARRILRRVNVKTRPTRQGKRRHATSKELCQFVGVWEA